MNVFIRELKANRKALIIWSVCMMLLVLSGMGKYTAYSSGSGSGDILDQLPRTMKVILGLDGNFDVTTISGFYAFLFPYIELTVGIHAALLGSGIIAKEERDKTTEFLIAKPVSRRAILSAKLLAALVNIAIVNIVSLSSSLAIVPSFNTGEDINAEILILHFTMFILQLIYLSLGAALAAFLRRPKLSGTVATNILLAGYIITKITGLFEHLEILNLFAPFNYFSLEKAVNERAISINAVLLSLALVAVFSVFTYFNYQRRDMNI